MRWIYIPKEGERSICSCILVGQGEYGLDRLLEFPCLLRADNINYLEMGREWLKDTNGNEEMKNVPALPGVIKTPDHHPRQVGWKRECDSCLHVVHKRSIKERP